jgi:hypothetical protein
MTKCKAGSLEPSAGRVWASLVGALILMLILAGLQMLTYTWVMKDRAAAEERAVRNKIHDSTQPVAAQADVKEGWKNEKNEFNSGPERRIER